MSRMSCGRWPSGAAEAVPWVRVTNLARTIEALKQSGGLDCWHGGDAAETVYERDLTGPCAVILGSEGAGMRRLTRDLCDFTVKLPMAGSVSSLNVSVAAGICLFEALRQRGGYSSDAAQSNAKLARCKALKAFVDSAPQNLVGRSTGPSSLLTPFDGWLLNHREYASATLRSCVHGPSGSV